MGSKQEGTAGEYDNIINQPLSKENSLAVFLSGFVRRRTWSRLWKGPGFGGHSRDWRRIRDRIEMDRN
jgi:hypothetical protein